MMHIWILPLLIQISFQHSGLKVGNASTVSSINHQVHQNWVNCRYHSDCLHGGSCELDSNNELSCNCKAGWTGRDCTETCTNGKQCVCPEGWGGYHCDVAMVSIKSFEELSCTTGVFIDGTCICDPGFHGATCNVFNCSRGGCGIHGKCSRNATYCECDSGFHGMTCNVFNCSQGGCEFNGRCSDDASHCECDVGWSGSFCELEYWITFQRRMVFDIDFKKSFSEYEQGFGDKKGGGDFWLGLKKIHDYTKNGTWELHIEVVAFNGSRFYSQYSGFKVLEPPLYNITWSALKGGTLGSYGMNDHKGAPFSTRDRDQDNNRWLHCSNAYASGGWWFNHCYRVYLNADRATSSTATYFRMSWYTGSSEWIPIIGSTMKMRRVE